MMDFIYSLFDTSDLFTLIVLTVCGIVGYVYVNWPDASRNRYKPNMGNGSTSAMNGKVSKPIADTFFERMSLEKREVLIVYGSQTGTAEELAGRLSKNFTRYGRKSLVLDPEEVSSDTDWNDLKDMKDYLLILCMATYGEGDPTDNAQKFIEWMKDSAGELDLSGLRYAVFGLGNKTYEHYNEIGKYCDARLEELGATRICSLGLGDDDANLEEDFCKWRDTLLPASAESFGWELDPEAENARQYRLELVTVAQDRLYTGEFGRLKSHVKPRPPYDQKTPYFASVAVNRELHSEKSDRSCRHIEFDLEGSSIRYEAGDHLGVYPTNDEHLVGKIIDLLDFDPEQAFKLINTDEESNKKHPFPCPTTFRTALLHYVDISSPVKPHVLKAIAEYASEEEQKKKLLAMAAGDEGAAIYNQYVVKERRCIVDILSDFSSCKPPVDFLCELMPRLQARYYSISSSPKHTSNRISITAIVTKYTIGERTIKGVCTNYLLDRKEGDKVPIFVRKSTFRINCNDSQTVIMIGPGTGLAPFRGLIQERKAILQKGTLSGKGTFALFFGCRHPEVDFIYSEELRSFKEEGVLSHLITAFSREGPNKVYVQHRLQENEDMVWAAIENGYILVCGEAKNMARDVVNTIMKIVEKKKGCSKEEAVAFCKQYEKSRHYMADVW